MFLDAIVFVLHIYHCFSLEKQIFKSYKWGRLRGPVAGRPGDQMMGSSLNLTEKHIKLTLTTYSSKLG